jgi:hypothetical protein
MGYDILGKAGKYWNCHQSDWINYLEVATAFGWAPEGTFYEGDKGGVGEQLFASYLGNDRQRVTDNDARAMGAALNLALATVNASAPMTDNQLAALKALKLFDCELLSENPQFTEEQRVKLRKIEADALAAHLSEVRTIRARDGTFDIDVRGMIDLADLASAGGFRIT